MNNHFSDAVAVVDVIDPDAYVASTVTTAYLDAQNFNAFAAIVQAGTLGASATLDAKIEQAQDSGGTGVKDLTGAAITQLTQAGTDSDKQAIIQFRPEDLDLANNFNFFRLSMTVAVATSDAGAVVLGYSPRSAPASGSDATSVDEIVTV